MKKVLITGAAGTIGINVIKYLLSEGKYEITAVDLKNSGNYKRLKKYKRRINLLFGDISDASFMEDAIKEMNYVIHLAGVDLPMGNINNKLTREIDFKGTENIVRIIDFYNPECYLLYASSASVYGNQEKDEVTVSTKPNLNNNDYYSLSKLEAEDIIKLKLDNYVIFRIPVVLTNITKENFIYSYNPTSKMEVVTDTDVSYMFVRAIDKIDKINKKTFNVGGGENCRTTGKKLNEDILKVFGITKKYIDNKLFIDKGFYSYYFKDSDKLEDILQFRNDSISSYLMRIKRRVKNRGLQKTIAKLFIKKEK
ncbi:MAG: NAD(P)-dependent oxidoreductase [Bacilli bacterium]|nr:NAD(P)-dependent oxidoreductase [Bacilli bacterium]